jgi:BON domain
MDKLRVAIGLFICALYLAAPALRAQGTPAANDQTIVDDINSKLFADSTLKTRDIRVSSQNGIVTLQGSVATRLEKAAVDQIASTEPGVQKVVDSLSITGETQQAPPPQAPSQQTPAQQAPPPQAPGAAAAPSGTTISAGTVITVRMIDSIDSRRNQPGQEFDATVESPVASGSQVVIPQGSTAKVRLVNSANSGRVEGSAQLELELISVTVNGTPYEVQSGYYQQHGSSRGQRTAKAAGGGAVLGGLIGAIAGGGKGAAIGAGSGAAIGTGASVAMKGSSIKVPSETKIDFTLRQPVTINSGPSGS